MSPDDRRALGRWLRSRRLARRLDVAELAALLKCDRTAIYHVERGTHLPGMTTFARWLELLGVDLLEALGARE